MNDDPSGPARTDPGLRVDPVRIGHRSMAPVIVAVVAIAFVGAAIVKPWQAPAAIRSVPEPAARSPLPSPSTGPWGNGPIVPIDLASAAIPHEAWGIRALVLEDSPAGTGSTEVSDDWQGLAVPDIGADPSPVMGLEQGVGAPGRPVLAVGITTPRDALALDVRWWRLDGAAGARRVIAASTPGPEPGSRLWLPDPQDATSAGGWPDADYRIDVLTAGRIVHVITRIHADSAAPPRAVPSGDSSIPVLQAIVTFPPGPFAIDGTGIQSVVADPGPPLDEIGAWLGPAAHLGGDTRVGRIVGDPIVGVGVVLEPGQTIIATELDRVAPTTDIPSLRTVELSGIDAYGTSTGPAVILTPPAGMALADGLYTLTMAIRDLDGTARTRSWTLEITPSVETRSPTQALVQLTYLLTGLGHVDDVGVPLVTDRDLGGTDGDGTCGGSARIRPSDETIGLSVDPGDDLRDLRLVPIDTIRRLDVDIAFARNVVDGLTLIALPRGGAAPRQYALIATIGAGSTRTERQYTVCVG